MGLGPFWIENWKTIIFLKIFVDYWFEKKIDRGMGGFGELYPIFFGCLQFFNFARPLTVERC